MYIITTEASFDSAHFLSGYDGKCKNIHGHRWTIKLEVFGENLKTNEHLRGMLIDFGDIKKELRELADYLDHSLIIEKDTLKLNTLTALKEEGFRILEFDFRPTAENFSKYVYDYFKNKGFNVNQAIVYETPNNLSTYKEV